MTNNDAPAPGGIEADTVEANCPFCGNSSTADSHDGMTGAQWYVSCDDLTCAGCSTPFQTYARECEAIAAWNTRAPSDDFAQGREAGLREAAGIAWHFVEGVGHPDWQNTIRDRILALIPTPAQPDPRDAVVNAAKDVIDQASDWYKARNGRTMSIEGDDGEKCWIVPFDAFEHLRNVVSGQASDPRDAVIAEVAMTWFSTQTRLSLLHYSPCYGDDHDQRVEWRVFEESGPINDREWEVVGRGQTALDAVLSARAALAKAGA